MKFATLNFTTWKYITSLLIYIFQTSKLVVITYEFFYNPMFLAKFITSV